MKQYEYVVVVERRVVEQYRVTAGSQAEAALVVGRGDSLPVCGESTVVRVTPKRGVPDCPEPAVVESDPLMDALREDRPSLVGTFLLNGGGYDDERVGR